MNPLRSHTLQEPEKSRYLRQLDHALRVLIHNFSSESDTNQQQAVVEYGMTKNWDWRRVPRHQNTYQTLGRLVERVRQEYQWFDWLTFPDNPLKNRGHFEELDISAEAGLPWMYSFLQLQNLKRDAPQLLKKTPGYDDTAKSLRDLLTQDNEEIATVPDKAKELHKQAMKRNFLEQLQKTELLGSELGQLSMTPEVTKLLNVGVENLWNIVYLQFLPGSSMFEAYILDCWQDNRSQPEIVEDKYGRGTLSPSFHGALRFGKDNAAWYILQSIDEKFPSIHPVHVSRALIGPFETKYTTFKSEIEHLPILDELLKEDESAGLFRFSRQYAYAPNHEEVQGEVRQVVERELWADECIVAPARFASRVAQSVLGTNVRVFEMKA